MRAMKVTALIGVLLAGNLLAQSVVLNNDGRKATFAIRNATIYPVTGAPIQNGTIVMSNGLITALGAAAAVPADAVTIDGTGLSVYPGMIDSGTNIGLTEVSSVAGTNDISELGDLNPNARVEVALNPHSNLIPVTRVNGVTTVLTQPEGGLISGQSAIIQLKGWTPAEMVLKAPAALHINFPRVRSGAQFGARPQDEEAEKEAKKSYTRQLDRLRDTFRDAQAYARALGARKTAPSTARLENDLILASMVDVVEGRVPVIMHANLAADIREAIKFADEMKLRMILSGGDEVQKVLKELKEKKIPVLLGPIFSLPQNEDDPYDMLYSNAAALQSAGIEFAIQSGDNHNARHLPYHAAISAAFGLPKEEALKAVTIYPARILGVADRIGSLEVGKIANVFVTNGDPLEIVTQVKEVFIGGERMPMDSRHTQLYEKFKQRPKKD